jgi:deoxyadenosine/deoxycytidine kinase
MMQRIVFLCGPDRCGKTEIGQELAGRSGIPYFKASSEHDTFLSCRVSRREAFLNQMRYADPRVFDVLKQTGHSVIFDRGFPCERVYSKVLGRKTDQQIIKHMDEMWASLGAVIVLCHRSSYLGISDDLDPRIDSHVLDAIHDEYFDFVDNVTRCRTLKLNVDDEDLDREVSEIMEFIK